MDEPAWLLYDPNGNLVWYENRLLVAIDAAGDTSLIISSCAENQVMSCPQFTDKMHLSVSVEVLKE